MATINGNRITQELGRLDAEDFEGTFDEVISNAQKLKVEFEEAHLPGGRLAPSIVSDTYPENNDGASTNRIYQGNWLGKEVCFDRIFIRFVRNYSEEVGDYYAVFGERDLLTEEKAAVDTRRVKDQKIYEERERKQYEELQKRFGKKD